MAGAVGIAALALLVAIAWAARPQLIAFAIERWLHANGAPDAALSVTEIGRDSLHIEGLVLGAGEEAAAEAIDVDYRLQGLAFPAVTAVAIDGLQLYVTPDAEKPLGALSDLLASIADGGDGAGGGPPVKCFNCRIVVRTGAGSVNVALSGQVAPGQDGRYDATALWTADSPFGTLGGQFAGGFTSAGTGEAQLDITEGKFAWPERNVSAEGMTGDARIELVEGRPALLTGHLRSGKLTQADLPTVALALDFEYRPEAARFSLSAVDPGNSFVAKIDADVADPQSAPRAKLHADLSFDETAPIWSLTGLPAPATGRTDVGAEIELPLPPLGEIAGLSLPEQFQAELNMDLQGLAWPGYASSVTGTGRVLLERADGRYTLTSLGPVALRGVLDPAQRAKLPLPAGLTAKVEGRLVATVADGSSVILTPGDGGVALAGNGAIRINNPADLLVSARGQFTADPGPTLAAFSIEHGEIWTTHWSLDPSNIDAAAIDSFLIKGSAAGTPAGVTGHAQVFAVGLSVEAAGAFAKKASANLKVDYALDTQHFAASLTEPGTLAADGLRISGLRSETQSVILAVRPADRPLIEADLAAPDGPIVQHAVKLDGFAMTVQPVDAGASGRINLAAQSADLAGQWSPATGWQGELAVHGGRALLPDRQLAAEGIETRMRLGAGASGRIDLRVGALTLAGDSAAPKLAVDGSATLTGNSVEFDLAAADPQKVLALTANGTHDLQTGNGAGQIHLAPLHFSPGGLQPRDILPSLGQEIEEATGTVSLDGSLAWKKGGVFGDANLRIEDLSLTGPDFDIARMNGAIALQSLSPLRTKADQQIAVASIDLGLPLHDGLATFTLLPGPLLAIKSAELHMAGGTVDVEPVTVDPAALAGQVRLHVRDVDLEQLLALAEVKGLSGTGRLDGVIPVTVLNGVTTITGARLDAQGPGHLAYAPDAPPPALQDSSETVSLVMSALTNFEYEKLWMTLDRQGSGDAEIGLHVTGKNPDFYNGYPIEFNLSLAGKLDQILKDSLVGYRVPDLVRERLEATRPAAGDQ